MKFRALPSAHHARHVESIINELKETHAFYGFVSRADPTDKQILKCLFYELSNQYHACLYFFQCISSCDSKYSNELRQF